MSLGCKFCTMVKRGRTLEWDGSQVKFLLGFSLDVLHWGANLISLSLCCPLQKMWIKPAESLQGVSEIMNAKPLASGRNITGRYLNTKPKKLFYIFSLCKN